MRRFQNNVIGRNIDLAVHMAEKLLSHDSPMLTDLRNKNDWKYNSGSGEEVYQKINSSNVIVPIFTYRPKLPWSKALGYYGNKAIHLNLYKLDDLSYPQLVGLLCHEWLHAGTGFKHGNNFKTKDKINYSVNYYVSENIQRWL